MKKEFAFFGLIASASLIQPAHAIELWSDDIHKFEIKGNLNYGAFYHGASVDDAANFDPTSVRGRSEIDFVYKGTINKDWSFGAKLEARISSFGQDDDKLTDIELDENYVYLKSKTYGEFVLGSDKGAAGDKHVRAPEFLATDLNSIEGQDFRAFSRLDRNRRDEDGALVVDDDGNNRTVRHFDTKDETDIDYDEDFNKLIYYSPKVLGFKFGVSYTPEAGDDGAGANSRSIAQRANGEIKDAVSLIITYENDFSGAAFAASAGLLTAKRVGAAPDPFAWNVGAKIFVDLGDESTFSIGGGYLMGEDGKSGQEDNVFIIGLAYRRGAWTTGIHYGWSKKEISALEETTHEVELGGSYRLTDYMGISAMVEYVQSEVEITGEPSYDADGVGVGLIYSVNF